MPAQKTQQRRNKSASSSSASQASTSRRRTDAAKVTPRSEDFGKWYLDVVREAELADYGPVRGTMVVRPYGYALWESIQGFLDQRFKEKGVSNVSLPCLIPQSFMSREAEHVEGFAPELAVVTVGGGKELEEPLVVRPTSEALVNHMLGRWVTSYRDLPMLLNQWANVVRWEMRTRPFIRTSEFLWQEGHTAHATAAEARAFALEMLRVYEDFAVNMAAMAVIAGRKSHIEKFAGASETYTIEAMMGDGRALQAGTSHDLGQNFARAFDTTFTDETQQQQHVWQTSWGMSTRMVGGVIMQHGDNQGAIIPPKMAPYQLIIVPILQSDAEVNASILSACERLLTYTLDAGLRAKVDDRPKMSPGQKYNYWEMKGVPVRVEVGPKDVIKNTCVIARRDMPGKSGKTFDVPIQFDTFSEHVIRLLDDIQDALLDRSRRAMEERIVDVDSMEGVREVIADGRWARCGWAGSDDDERRVKEETSATIRCFPLDQPPEPRSCIVTGQSDVEVCIFAKSY